MKDRWTSPTRALKSSRWTTNDRRFLPYLLVGAGSFVGGNARYVLGRWVGGLVDARFPLGTFLINVGAWFLLGFLAGLLATRALPHSDSLRLALGVGLCGGFTTFSTFVREPRPPRGRPARI